MILRLPQKILILVIAACIVFSAIITDICEEDDHDCPGKECLTCLHIKIAKSFIKTTAVFTDYSVIQCRTPVKFTEHKAIHDSQVSLKVRFNT